MSSNISQEVQEFNPCFIQDKEANFLVSQKNIYKILQPQYLQNCINLISSQKDNDIILKTKYMIKDILSESIEDIYDTRQTDEECLTDQIILINHNIYQTSQLQKKKNTTIDQSSDFNFNKQNDNSFVNNLETNSFEENFDNYNFFKNKKDYKQNVQKANDNTKQVQTIESQQENNYPQNDLLDYDRLRKNKKIYFPATGKRESSKKFVSFQQDQGQLDIIQKKISKKLSLRLTRSTTRQLIQQVQCQDEPNEFDEDQELKNKPFPMQSTSSQQQCSDTTKCSSNSTNQCQSNQNYSDQNKPQDQIDPQLDYFIEKNLDSKQNIGNNSQADIFQISNDLIKNITISKLQSLKDRQANIASDKSNTVLSQQFMQAKKELSTYLNYNLNDEEIQHLLNISHKNFDFVFQLVSKNIIFFKKYLLQRLDDREIKKKKIEVLSKKKKYIVNQFVWPNPKVD